MRAPSRLPSILAHVLASTALLACGGKTAEVGDDLFGNNPSGTSSTSSSGGTQTTNPGTPTPPSTTNPPPPTNPPTSKDAGVPPKPDAGCSTPPELVKQSYGCADVFYQACGWPAGVDPSDGFDQTECAKLCGKNPNGFTYWGCSEYLLDDLPGPSVECYTCVEGRRPEGFVERALERTVAGWLAHAADLERVSVDAFRILARELAFHGAPHELVSAACRAAEDEVRHANALGGLARREGATLSEVPVEHRATRALLAIALENAVEGCVRETFGAIVAGWQAKHAHRVDIRRAMARIYVDETAHADLAWNVHAWILTMLSREERAEVEAAMERAFAELTRSAGDPLPDPWITDLGLPRPAQARRLVRDLVTSLTEYARAA
jgi:hypothetical protein